MFQSTPSGGKATNVSSDFPAIRYVSIHAFRGEGDLITAMRVDTAKFQSTPSGGKATRLLFALASLGKFQSTPSGGKATN